MSKDLMFLEKCNLDETIEKKFKKYILEVSDAIEAYGFKMTSYTDYAKESILELQDSVKNNFKEYGSNLLFTNLLENSLDDVVQDIVNYTIEDTSIRNTIYSPEKLNEKTFNLYQDLKFLNERLLNSFKDFNT